MKIGFLLGGAAAALTLSSSVQAQVVSEVAAMTVSHEVFDADLLPAGALLLGDINAATISGNSLGLANISLTPSTAALGGLNTNVYGSALGLDPAGSGSMMRIDNLGSFGAFNASVELSGDSTEFGLAVSDWVSTMVLDFYSNGALVTSFTTTSYGNLGFENHKYFQMTGGTFDRVDMRASSTAGNWCIPAMSIEAAGPTGPSLSLTCAGGSATASVSGATAGGPVAFVYGPAGVFVWGGTPCTGTALDLVPVSAPIVLTADGSGNVSITRPVGPAACGSGVLVQAADVATCTTTNSAAL